jgi:uncharacterized lipoprotein YddW (UPF0748 family)
MARCDRRRQFCVAGVDDPGPASPRPAPTIALLAALLLLAGCATIPAPLPPADNPPPAPREFRGAWVATVANIDWPSKPGLSAGQMRAEMRALLDNAQALHLNALIFQVRPAADAVYRSDLEPWTEYLTGVQGWAPDKGYDPLREWVDEAHRRGLELHAWFNPYRARHHTARSEPAATHISRTHPEAVKTYGDMLWMDPAEPAASAQTLAVIRDVVRRYDVDGVHIDDYFYPYPIKAPAAGAAPAAATPPPDLDFPDDPSWQRYLAGGGKLARADWRRQNVNGLIEQMYRAVHAEKPWVRVGVSPFGLGRPDRRPPGVEGFSQYDKLYADVELWLEHGWLDYLAPQLYWPHESAHQPFVPLLDYWLRQNTAGRHVWPGVFTSAINDTPKGWPAEEIVRELELARTRPAATGHIHFSLIALLQDRKGVATRLARETYPEAALVPATPWLGGEAPRAPRLGLRHGAGGDRIIIHASWFGRKATAFAVWLRQGGQWRFSVRPAADPVVALPAGAPVDLVVVSPVDRLGQEGPRVALRIDTDGKTAH